MSELDLNAIRDRVASDKRRQTRSRAGNTMRQSEHDRAALLEALEEAVGLLRQMEDPNDYDRTLGQRIDAFLSRFATKEPEK